MKKVNKRGFTLIELLAVIVILAIIALIAVPIVLNMINSARKSAARSAALGYIDAIEYNNGFASLGSDAEVSGYTKITSGNVSEITSTLGSHLKGKAPTSGSVVIDSNGKVTSATLCISGYTVTYENNDVSNVTSGCSSNNNNQQAQGTISTCEGCVFAFYNDNNILNWGEEGDTLTNYTNDYKSLNKPVFLGHILENNKVVRAFVCGILNYGTNNEMPVCIEATENGVKNDENIALIANLNPNENYSCDEWGNCNDDNIMLDPDYSTVNVAYSTSGEVQYQCIAEADVDSKHMYCMEN